MASPQSTSARLIYQNNTEDGLTRLMASFTHIPEQGSSMPFIAPLLSMLIEEVNEWINGNAQERPPGTILFHKIDLERFPPVEVSMLDTGELASVQRCQVNAQYMIRVLTMPNQHCMFVRLCGNGCGRGARRFQAWHKALSFTDKIIACEKRSLHLSSEQLTPCSLFKRKRATSAREHDDTSGSLLTELDQSDEDTGGKDKNEILDDDYEEDTGSSHSASSSSGYSDNDSVSENEVEERGRRYHAFSKGRRATHIKKSKARRRRRIDKSKPLAVQRDGFRRHDPRNVEEARPHVLLQSSTPEAGRLRGTKNVRQASSEHGPLTQRTGRPRLRIFHQQSIGTYLRTFSSAYTMQKPNGSAKGPTRPVRIQTAPVATMSRSSASTTGPKNSIFTPGQPASSLPPPEPRLTMTTNPHSTPIFSRRSSSPKIKISPSPELEEISGEHWMPNQRERHAAFPLTPIPLDLDITFHFYTTRPNTAISRPLSSCSTMISFFDEVLSAWTTFSQAARSGAFGDGGGQDRLRGVLVAYEGGKREVYVPWKSADAWGAMMTGLKREGKVDVEVRCVGEGV